MDNEMNANYDNDAESTDSNETNESEVPAESDVNTIEELHSSNEANVHEENNQVSTSEAVQEFDLTLPASHSYLGTNLEELRGRTILDDGIYMNLPLLIKRSMVLFPGQTLPLAVFDTDVINMLEKCIQKNRTFGVVSYQQNKTEQIGTTAEIYEYSHGSPGEGFRTKAKGRQRFQILQMKQGFHEISANVKILPEITLSHPFFEQRLNSLNHQRIKIPTNEKEQRKQDKIERIEALITPWPSWVYRQYDPYRLAYKIKQHLHFIETKGSYIPSNPTDLSFWVAQNLPLNVEERVKLLKYDCSISRLQWELEYLTKDRVLACSKCEKIIAKQLDIFPMSKDGPQNTFCNSSGFIHDTVTLYRAKNLKLQDHPPSSEYSWFPGYAWTIANCKGCGEHMGWRFTVEKDKTLKPTSFWGLSRLNLISKKVSKNTNKMNDSKLSQDQSDSEDNHDNSTTN